MGECDTIMVLFQFFFLADGMGEIWVIFLWAKVIPEIMLIKGLINPFKMTERSKNSSKVP